MKDTASKLSKIIEDLGHIAIELSEPINMEIFDLRLKLIRVYDKIKPSAEETPTLIALKSNHDESVVITTEDQFEYIDRSEIYDKYGQLLGEEYKGCEVLAYNFFNGHNWQTIIIEDDWLLPEYERLAESEEKELLEDYKFALDNEEGESKIGAKTYYQGKENQFCSGNYASDWTVAWVAY